MDSGRGRSESGHLMDPEEEESKRKAELERLVIEVSGSDRMMARNRRQGKRKQGPVARSAMVTSEKAVNILLGAGRYYYNATLDINAFTTRCVVITRPLHRSPVALTLSAPPPTPTLQSLLPLPKTTGNTSPATFSVGRRRPYPFPTAVSPLALEKHLSSLCFTVHS